MCAQHMGKNGDNFHVYFLQLKRLRETNDLSEWMKNETSEVLQIS